MAFYHRVLGIAVLGSVSLLSGCGAFFQCEGKSDCPATGTTTPGNGDYVYVSNSTGGTTKINEYSLASGTLTAISGSPFNLGYVPVAMVVSPSNNFLYVASNASAPSPGAGVYVYAISSTGALSAANGGQPFFTDQGIASMDISPDGYFLFTVGDSNSGAILTEYPLDPTTGIAQKGTPPIFPALGTSLVASQTTCSIANSTAPISQECTVKVSPNSDYVAVALAGSGLETYPDSGGSTGGIPSGYAVQTVAPPGGFADFSLAFDTNEYLYVASTNDLTSYTGPGNLTQDDQYTYPLFSANTYVKARAVTVSAAGYVYTANENAGTISVFSLPGSGVITAQGTVTGPTNVSALGIDSTGDYLVAAGYNTTSGLQVFSISSSGALTAVGTPEPTAASGGTTLVPVVMALTH